MILNMLWTSFFVFIVALWTTVLSALMTIVHQSFISQQEKESDLHFMSISAKQKNKEKTL